MKLIFIISLLVFGLSSPTQDLTQKLLKLRDDRNLMGIQLRITQIQQQSSKLLYQNGVGNKNESASIQNNTMFRVASLSKSFSSVGIMQLVQTGKLRLNQSISSILGYQVRNPFFPKAEITVEMILTHQSSLIECQPYYTQFLTDTTRALDGSQVPSLRQILINGGKYYNTCLYSAVHAPGTYFNYVNLNFGIAGTIIEAVSGQRFDQYTTKHILQYLNRGASNTPTFNPTDIKNVSDLGTIFVGQKGKWVPNYDYYPDGVIPEKNLVGYKIGTNAVIFGPQGSLRASAIHLANYIEMFLNKGIFEGKKILEPSSVVQIFKPRYQYNKGNGPLNDYHTYGLGMYSTTYYRNDQIISHQVTTGHEGAAYGLISGYYFWKNYVFAYIINGALNGYKYGTGTIYEGERLAIHEAVEEFVVGVQEEKMAQQ